MLTIQIRWIINFHQFLQIYYKFILPHSIINIYNFHLYLLLYKYTPQKLKIFLLLMSYIIFKHSQKNYRIKQKNLSLLIYIQQLKLLRLVLGKVFQLLHHFLLNSYFLLISVNNQCNFIFFLLSFSLIFSYLKIY